MDPDAPKDVDGSTPLMRASKCGHADVVQLLLEAGAEKDFRDLSGGTALMCAACSGRVSVVRLLLGAGAQKDVHDLLGNTAVILAGFYGRAPVMQLLLKAGAQVDFRDNDGRTALMDAACNGHSRVVRLLLEASAQMDAGDSQGRTALMDAACNGHDPVVWRLREAGAQMDARDSQGRTALMDAECNCQILDADAQKNPCDDEGQTLLMMATEHDVLPPMEASATNVQEGNGCRARKSGELRNSLEPSAIQETRWISDPGFRVARGRTRIIIILLILLLLLINLLDLNTCPKQHICNIYENLASDYAWQKRVHQSAESPTSCSGSSLFSTPSSSPPATGGAEMPARLISQKCRRPHAGSTAKREVDGGAGFLLRHFPFVITIKVRKPCELL